MRFDRPSPWGGATIGPPAKERDRLFGDRETFFRWFKAPRPSCRVADRQHVTLGGRDWFGLFTPGHTDDHLCLYDEEGGVLLSGDQVLPTITPHISGLIPDDPLTQYIESLDRLAELPLVEIVLPAHGQPFHNLPRRTAEIKAHHVERLEKLRQLCDVPEWTSVVDLTHQLSLRARGVQWPRRRPMLTSNACGSSERSKRARGIRGHFIQGLTSGP